MNKRIKKKKYKQAAFRSKKEYLESPNIISFCGHMILFGSVAPVYPPEYYRRNINNGKTDF